ncbi:hypothetical protein FACS18949_17380 [Clostridia bacterium]|nr:hypothetical protein FACS189425_05190 [Clostridia bacterium]GHV37226.1 hypothetical protein FACS18949_17380 [Clostridia bacterium]
MNNSFLKRSYRHYYTQCFSGEWEEVEAHATARGESLNGFVNRAIDEAVERDNRADTHE